MIDRLGLGGAAGARPEAPASTPPRDAGTPGGAPAFAALLGAALAPASAARPLTRPAAADPAGEPGGPDGDAAAELGAADPAGLAAASRVPDSGYGITPMTLDVAPAEPAAAEAARDEAPVEGGAAGAAEAAGAAGEGAAGAAAADVPAAAHGVHRGLDAVDPALRERVQRVIERMRTEHGHDVRVTETVRSQARQDQLFAQGRTADGPVVTWTRSSNHTRGRAVDVMIDGGWEDTRAFATLQRVAREEGLHTLGMRDPGHLELPSAAPGTRDVGGRRFDLASLAELGGPDVKVRVAELLVDDGTAPARLAPAARVAAPAAVATPAPVAQVATVARVASVAPVATVARVAAPGAPAAVGAAGAVGGARRVGGGRAAVAGAAGTAGTAGATAEGSAAGGRGAPPRVQDAAADASAPYRATAAATTATPAATPAGAPATPGAQAAAADAGRRQAGDERAAERAADATAAVVDAAAAGEAGREGGLHGAVGGARDGAATARPAEVAAPSAADALARLDRIEALREGAAARPMSHLTLMVENAAGGEDRIRVDLRGAAVGATLELSDAATAERVGAALGELQQALEQRGLETDALRVRRQAAAVPESLEMGRVAGLALEREAGRGGSSTSTGQQPAPQRDRDGRPTADDARRDPSDSRHRSRREHKEGR